MEQERLINYNASAALFFATRISYLLSLSFIMSGMLSAGGKSCPCDFGGRKALGGGSTVLGVVSHGLRDAV